jgi:hypothetical protein
MRIINFWHVPLFARLIFRASHLSRQRKLALFYSHVRPTEQDLVLDVGVAPEPWSLASGCRIVENFVEAMYPWPERIIALSRDDLAGFNSVYAAVRPVQGDACHLPFADKSVDIVFTNAVIEHVGNRERQAELVRECLRVARRAVFLAAPNRWFPYDTHVAFPLIHWLPRSVWKHTLSEPELHLLSPVELLRLFPRSAHSDLLSPPWAPSVAVLARPAPAAPPSQASMNTANTGRR